MDAISSMEFDYVASGHYAHVIHSSSDEDEKRTSVLELSNDMVPTQMFVYFSIHVFYFFFVYNVCCILTQTHALLKSICSQTKYIKIKAAVKQLLCVFTILPKIWVMLKLICYQAKTRKEERLSNNH